ncbi:vacuolar protein sorting 8 isoform X3 [Dermacentor variabilis]|uniref:vacuolar protein sorting 8 isoform X3 n=1 Tax=Dermacentor variabilis TaxID=34621 RepID=UPI003F5C22CD
MDEASNGGGGRPRNDTIATEDATLAFNIEELDDKEFELPPVENPPTLESILNEVDGGSLSDEEVPNQAIFHGSCDSVSLGSADSRSLPAEKVGTHPNSILRHVILRGVSSQLRSAVERVDSGKPTAMAVSSLIAVGTFHGLVLVFDPEQALKWCLGSIQLGEQYGSVSAMGFNTDCSRLLCGYAKGQLTMWDLTNGKLLRTIVDIHPPQMAILHVKFTDDPTLAICSDSGGSVYELNFRQVKVLNSRTCESVCIFSGSDRQSRKQKWPPPGASRVLRKMKDLMILQHLQLILLMDRTAASLRMLPFHRTDSQSDSDASQPATSAAAARRGEVCAMEPLHVSPEVARHPSQEVSLLALATVTKVIVVTVRPVLRVRFTHSLKADPNTLPLLSWQFVVIQVSASARIIDPVLAFGRHSTIFFFQVNIPSLDKIIFVPLQKIQVQYTVQNFTWLNSRTLAALDTSENLHVLDVRSQEELEVLDMSDVQMVYGTSHFKGHATGGNVSKAMVAAAERACYHSMAGCGSQVLLLGLASVHVLSLRTWLERLELLCQQQLYAEALHLARSLYRDEAKAVCGLVGKKVRRQRQVATRTQELLEALAAGPPDCVQLLVPLCVRLALELREHVPDLLDKLYTLLSMELKGKFLDSLPVHVLEGELHSPSPALAKDLVDQLASMGQFELLERCLVCLDVACLDLHQVMTLCWKHHLYDGIIYVHNRALSDFTTPIQEMMAVLWQALDSGQQLTDSQVLLGNKLLVYISCCLAGRGYPHGELCADQVAAVKKDVLQCITSLRGASTDDRATFPYLRTLLRFSTREFLNVLALAFEEPEFATEVGLAQKQRLVDILLQIMVQSQGFLPTQVGALFTFLARQLALPDNNLVVDRFLFEQVLEHLTHPGDETRREERQQALLELLQAGGLASVDQAHLLSLAEQSHFYRVCEHLYEKQHLYHKILLCYLDDPSRKLQSFEYARRILASPDVSEQEKSLLQDQLLSSLEALMQVDSRATSQLMLQHLAHRVDDIVHHLEGQPWVLYQFLQGVWNSREAPTQGAKDSVAAAVQERYIELMCQFDPDAVGPFLVSAEGYRIEETLEICHRHKVLDATAYLLEKTGDVQGALTILLQFLDTQLQACAQQGPMREQLLQGARTRLQAAVELCQRSCPFLSAAEREALWFPVLERVMAPQRQLRSALGADKGGYHCQCGTPKQQWRPAEQAERAERDYFSSDFLLLTHQLLGSMMGFVALPHILHKLMQDPAYSTGKFGEVRHFVVKMLDTHNYEKLQAAANRAYVSHTAACLACGKGFSEPGAVVMFRCSHCYHRTCLATLGPAERAREVCCQCCTSQPLGQPLQCPLQAGATSRSFPDALLPVLLKDSLRLRLAPARPPDIKLDI